MRRGRRRLSSLKIEGELEIVPELGIVYFHERHSGRTILRMCSLPKPIPVNMLNWEHGEWMMDVTHMFGCNWKERRRV